MSGLPSVIPLRLAGPVVPASCGLWIFGYPWFIRPIRLIRPIRPIRRQRKCRTRRLKLTLLVCAFLACTTLGTLYYVGVLDDNFRTIAAGRVYRSAQMSGPHLAEAVKQYGLKSVLNLQSEAVKAQWYQDEVKTCAALGVEHHTVPIHLGRLTEPENVATLIDRLEQGPFPLLLHCRAGADRSGLAGALYLMVVEKKSLDEALSAQVTWRYGHTPLGQAVAIDEFFALYRATANGRDIKTWVTTVYPGLFAERKTR